MKDAVRSLTVSLFILGTLFDYDKIVLKLFFHVELQPVLFCTTFLLPA